MALLFRLFSWFDEIFLYFWTDRFCQRAPDEEKVPKQMKRGQQQTWKKKSSSHLVEENQLLCVVTSFLGRCRTEFLFVWLQFTVLDRNWFHSWNGKSIDIIFSDVVHILRLYKMSRVKKKNKLLLLASATPINRMNTTHTINSPRVNANMNKIPKKT